MLQASTQRKRVGAVLQGAVVHQLVDIDGLGIGAEAFQAHRPGPRLQRVRVLRRVSLVGAELVEVVVGNGLGLGCDGCAGEGEGARLGVKPG